LFLLFNRDDKTNNRRCRGNGNVDETSEFGDGLEANDSEYVGEEE